MNRYTTLCLVLGATLVSATTLAQTPASASPPSATASVSTAAETGLAAVYSSRLTGHKTASGQIYDPHKLTAAHKTLPFGTRLKVTNTHNGKSVVVRINDRGPKQAGRILDLTPRAAHALGIRRLGMAEVSAEPVQ